MKNKLLKSPLKVLAATSVTIFTLLSVFTSTAAWFDSRRSLDNNGDQFEVTSVHNLQEIRFYPSTTANVEHGYVFSTSPMQTITVSATPSTYDDWEYTDGSSSAAPYSDASPVTMNPQIVDPTDSSGVRMVDDPFSPISPYHPILMVIEYRESITSTNESPLYVKMETSSNFLTPSRSSIAKVTEDLPAYYGTIQNDSRFPLSSLIHTYSKGYANANAIPFQYALDSDEGTESKPYIGGLEHGSFASLVTINGSTAPIFDKNPSIFTAETNQTVKCVAVILEYYVDVIEYIYSYYVGLEALEFDHDAFCDWRLMV